MNNGRFAISVHILTLLADAAAEWVPSEYLAGSININPVLVRKELSNLREHGLVISKEGKSGGNRLARNPEQIFMSDVYKAVRQKDLLGKSINAPNPQCDVGKEINKHLDSLYDEAEKALLLSLERKSLSDFHKQFS
ncbi:Rrf2 family transcriptional regulator [Dyadobacter sediminis]|uniref:Rrf2 family transcriptional regulator n=1 Tax=Dyadobacter sediminis TaxID=1493691 RepID=A0A5R9KJ68_9BACT|nr:Rrf2 family transcriptional regulator [Dyadobacter sediminis]TLU96258.1 Rrf2 family transcriptional regulator [Dyadobacter sediminis]GGB80622.1 Rrf2 family transcriptional regulator [Dyadobacter sediminis]